MCGYFEMAAAGCRWREEQVNDELKSKMDAAFADLWKMSQDHNVPLRTASFALALQRVRARYREPWLQLVVVSGTCIAANLGSMRSWEAACHGCGCLYLRRCRRITAS